jgi:lysophospholipase L1-like esterase
VPRFDVRAPIQIRLLLAATVAAGVVAGVTVPGARASTAGPTEAASAATSNDTSGSGLVQVVSPQTAPRRFVALGDSLTSWSFAAGSASASTAGTWPSLLASLHADLKLVHNAGVPGNTTAQMLARLARDVFAYSPDVLFVMGGTNDIGDNWGTSVIVANLRSIVRAAKARDIEVVLLTIPPNNASYQYKLKRIVAANTAIKKMAAEEGVAVIDVYSALATRGGRLKTAYAAADRLHLSAAGELVVAETVYRAVYPAGPETRNPAAPVKPVPPAPPAPPAGFLPPAGPPPAAPPTQDPARQPQSSESGS